MTHPRRARFYLHDGTRRRAEADQHNFISKIVQVLRRSGYEVSYHHNSPTERLKAVTRRGYALCEMTPPLNARGVTFRKVYHFPFWQIQTTDKRWEWDVARAAFDPRDCPPQDAERFFRFWQKRTFGNLLDGVGDDGFVYVPLQGRLLDHRSFQFCSPLEMVRRTRAACPGRKIIATLHPKEDYSVDERAALGALCKNDPDLSVQLGGRDALLPRCSFLVTMTSSVAFDAMFFGKPSITFGQTDFHHVMLDGMCADSFAQVRHHAPDYAAYLWWIWQHNAVNAGHASAEEKIAAKLADAGWPL